jgi:hypothetical protein
MICAEMGEEERYMSSTMGTHPNLFKFMERPLGICPDAHIRYAEYITICC